MSIFLGKKLECPVSWGDDFKVEHENILLEAAENRPVFITEFPASIKPFYMSTVEGKSGEVAQCFDLLMPVGGEVVGGSLRETSHKKLSESIAANGLKGLEWYNAIIFINIMNCIVSISPMNNV